MKFGKIKFNDWAGGDDMYVSFTDEVGAVILNLITFDGFIKTQGISEDKLIWHIRFTDNLPDLKENFEKQNHPIFYKKDLEDAKLYVNSFLNRMDKLKAVM